MLSAPTAINPQLGELRVNTKSLKIVLISSMGLNWGGSEELWHGAMTRLAIEGHRVHVVKTNIDFSHPKIKMLESSGIVVYDFHRHHATTMGRWIRKLIHTVLPPYRDAAESWLEQMIRKVNPDLVVVAQGGNYDGLNFINICSKLQIKYALICQKASDHDWPHDRIRETMRHAFVNAQRVFFVSHHNYELTELQIGARLPNGEVVRNPVNLTLRSPQPWPEETGNYRLACIARLHAFDKGQDILLRVISKEKWRRRPVHITFFGEGEHQQAFRDAAALLDIANVQFMGHSSDIAAEWQTHHALVLPSRSEGLPLALIEAMICGRPAITTRVGGAEEIVRDGLNGFLAQSASDQSIDEALERAWAKRGQWRELGLRASADALAFLPADPGQLLARQIANIAQASGSSDG